jgi:predicted DNA-binding protein
MSKFPEFLNFRAPSGTSNALEALAAAEGKRSSEIVREAVADRIRASQAATERQAA